MRLKAAFINTVVPLLAMSSCFFLTDFDELGGAAAGGAGGTEVGGGGTAGTGGATGGGGGSGAAGGAGGSIPCPPPNVDYSDIVLNELAPKGIPEDWIELKNHGAEAVPLCAAFITQKYDGVTPPGGGDRFTFGPVTIGAGAYLVLHQNDDFAFGLAKDEPERITLFAPDATVLDDTSWVASPGPGNEFTAVDSWARIPDGDGTFKKVPSPTKGSENVDLGGGGSGGN